MEAVHSLELNSRIFGFGVSSDVSEQPRGKEIIIGCKNRSANTQSELKKLSRHFHDIHSLENGLIKCQNQIYDLCLILIEAPSHLYNSSPSYYYSQCVLVPEYAVKLSKASDWTLTCGSIIEKTECLEENSWHQIYDKDKRTRIQIIKDAFKEKFYGIKELSYIKY